MDGLVVVAESINFHRLADGTHRAVFVTKFEGGRTEVTIVTVGEDGEPISVQENAPRLGIRKEAGPSQL